jgi:Papain-like cysteine protease AvrRpt2
MTLCWAASLAMLRREPTVDGMMNVVDRSHVSGRINSAQIPEVARRNGCAILPLPPLFIVNALETAARPRAVALFVTLRDASRASIGSNGHVIVVDGLRGDGTPAGTQVHVHDPWETTGASRTFQHLTSQYWRSVDFIARRT